jgi:hypothetical protein
MKILIKNLAISSIITLLTIVFIAILPETVVNYIAVIMSITGLFLVIMTLVQEILNKP